MADLAIDRFRAKGLRTSEELLAQARALSLSSDPNLLLGYLESSVAIALERPRWRDRTDLAVALRTVEIAAAKR